MAAFLNMEKNPSYVRSHMKIITVMIHIHTFLLFLCAVKSVALLAMELVALGFQWA